MPRGRIVRRSSRGVRGGGARRQTEWISAPPSEDTITGGTGSILLTTLTAIGLAKRPFTVIRTVGLLYVNSDQVANSETQALAWGSAVVSEQATAIGVTAVPTPATDIESDLWLAYVPLINATQVASSIGMGFAAGTGVQFDSRAMRKVEDGQDLITVVETGGISDGVVVRVWFRTLIKLH